MRETSFPSVFGGAELRVALAVSAVTPGRIVPVLVEPVTLSPLYAPLLPLDLTGLDEATAAARLLARLAGVDRRAPPFSRADRRRRTSWGSPARCLVCGGCRRAIPGSPAG